MTDGIISGAGNSRFLKTVANAKALYPTWDAALDALIAGTFPIDLNGINPAGWEVQGDKLGKATLLTDALCSALSLATTATPTQAMEKIRSMAAAAQSTANSANSNANGRLRSQTGSYTGTGNPGTVNLTFSIPWKVLFVQYSDNFNAFSALGVFLSNGDIAHVIRAGYYPNKLSFAPSTYGISWNTKSGEDLNADGKPYKWTAIG